jgi:hypothetical protein
VAKLTKGNIYNVLCRPFHQNAPWRRLIYLGYDRTTGKHKFSSRITVSPSRLWKRVRRTSQS